MNPLSTKITGHAFETVKRGYEPAAVDRYLRDLVGAVEALEDELTIAQTKIAALEKRVRGDRDADTVVQTAFLAAAEAKSKLLEEAEYKAKEIIAAAEARAQGMTAGTGLDDSAAILEEAKLLKAEAEKRLHEAKQEARDVVAHADQEAKAILSAARAEAGRPVDSHEASAGRDQAELQRITTLLEHLDSAVAAALRELGPTDRNVAFVLDDAAMPAPVTAEREAGLMG